MLWEKGLPAAFSFSIRVAIPPGTNPRPIFGSPLFPGGSIYKQIRHQIRISRARKPLTRVSQVQRRSGTMRTRKTGHFQGATACKASRPLAETPSRAAGRTGVVMFCAMKHTGDNVPLNHRGKVFPQTISRCGKGRPPLGFRSLQLRCK